MKPFTKSKGLLAILYVAALSLLVVASATASQPADQPEPYEEYLQAAHDVWNFQGAALVAKNGKVIFKNGYGMASIELSVPNTAETKFLIGSITKQFTATAVMQLVEKGLVNLDDPITKYLPDYPKETGDKVTIHHLLRHTAGVPSYTDMPDAMARRTQPVTLDELVGLFKDKPLDFEPGEQFKYSNSGYLLLGIVIEKASGMTYEDYLRQNIFDVIGMDNSGYAHQDKIIPGRACGYREGQDDELLNDYVVHMSWPYAAGGLYSTVEDMLRWDQALYTEKLLTKGSLEKMFTPGLRDYGYGWGIGQIAGHKLVSHDGGIDGFSTSFFRCVDDNICVVVFSNNINAPVTSIAAGLMAIALGEPYDLPIVKSPIEIDTARLVNYAGVYKVNATDNRIISVEDGKIYSMRTGGQQRRLLPEDVDKFFFEYDHNLTLRFQRDENGAVVSHIIHQRGQDEEPAVRLSDEEAKAVLAAYEPADVDPAIFDDYVGQYQLMPEFILTVTRKGDRLFIRGNDQEDDELFPRSESLFFMKAIDAEVNFVRDDTGKVTRLIFHQGGREMPAEKIK